MAGCHPKRGGVVTIMCHWVLHHFKGWQSWTPVHVWDLQWKGLFHSSQRTHDVATSFWRFNTVIITSCVRWVHDELATPRVRTEWGMNYWCYLYSLTSLQWRHDGLDGASNHQPHDSLLNRLCRRRSKQISKLRVTGLCEGNSPVTGELPAQMVSNAENVSIRWRHHVSTLGCRGRIGN